MRGGVYRLPCSLPFECNAQSTVAIASGATVGSNIVTTVKILPDVTNADNRNVLFKTVHLEIGPFQTSAGLNSGATVQMLAFATSTGAAIQLDRPKQLSLVNPTRLVMRIPNWVLGPVQCGNGDSIFAVLVTLPVPAAVAVSIPFFVRVRGDITLPETNSF